MLSISGLRSWVWSPGTRGRGLVSGLGPARLHFALSGTESCRFSRVSADTTPVFFPLGVTWDSGLSTHGCESSSGQHSWIFPVAGRCLLTTTAKSGVWTILSNLLLNLTLWCFFFLIMLILLGSFLSLIYTDRMYFINKSHILCRM